MTNCNSATPDEGKNSNKKSNQRRTPSLEDIEETETCLCVEQQLERVHAFLVERGADSEMLDAIEYLREDNDRWIDPKIAEDLRTGRLHSGEA